MKNPLSEHLIQQWHPTKNLPLMPTEVSAGSKQQIWWICNKGHEWQQNPQARKIRNKDTFNQCVYCSGKRTLPGFNDLATVNSALASEWNVSKNTPLSPTQVTQHSNKIVWWSGRCGHEWEATISSRTLGNKCPYCSHQKILPGFETLNVTHPELASQFHPYKNKKLTAKTVTSGSDKVIWWLGKCNHSWEAPISARVRGNGCLYCTGRKILPGFNDLPTTHPILAQQWHPTKNYPLQPSDVSKGTPKKVWWFDSSCGHEWEAMVYSRAALNNASKCPVCVNQKIIPGINDLVTSQPQLALEFHPTKNYPLTASSISAGSNRKVWWLGNCGHEWETTVSSRVNGNGCGECWKNSYVSQPEQEIYDFLMELGFSVDRSRRDLLGNRQEVDLYVPKHKVGIEFNGLYWHSEQAGKASNYHQMKYEVAKKVGIDLFQIWEDDWRDKKSLVMRLLAYKLGAISSLAFSKRFSKLESESISAHDMITVPITGEEARCFFEENHLEGAAMGFYYLGLKDENGVLRVAISLENRKSALTKEVMITRYATLGLVTDGLIKLIDYYSNQYPVSIFSAVSENSTSSGDLYEQAEFSKVGDLPPAYSYLIGKKRVAPQEVTSSENLDIIWDAGSTLYRRSV
jgi:DNA-directed RNA polymerase subunit RPC12/RpoP